MGMKKPTERPARPLPPRTILVDGQRVREPADVTRLRNERLNARLEWPRWYFDTGRPARSPVADAMEGGE